MSREEIAQVFAEECPNATDVHHALIVTIRAWNAVYNGWYSEHYEVHGLGADTSVHFHCGGYSRFIGTGASVADAAHGLITQLWADIDEASEAAQ